MNQEEPVSAEQHKPNILRFSIGIVTGIIAVALGTWIFTDPMWLRIVFWVLGTIQLVTSLWHTPQVLRYLSAK